LHTSASLLLPERNERRLRFRRAQPCFHSDKPVIARYFRIQATQRKTVPADFSNGAKDTWLFAD
jgi:hypothetical protein